MLDRTQASSKSNVIKLKFECGKKDEKQLTIFHSVCLVYCIPKIGGVLKMFVSYDDTVVGCTMDNTLTINIGEFEKRI